MARDDQGTSRHRLGGPDRRSGGENLVSTPIRIDICQLANGEGLALPEYQSPHAAGVDLLAAVPESAPLILAPGQRALVPTGLTIALPPGYEAQIRPRSGLRFQPGI